MVSRPSRSRLLGEGEDIPRLDEAEQLEESEPLQERVGLVCSFVNKWDDVAEWEGPAACASTARPKFDLAGA